MDKISHIYQRFHYLLDFPQVLEINKVIVVDNQFHTRFQIQQFVRLREGRPFWVYV